MRLKDIVKITPRFQRSVRIDTDFGTKTAVDGFVCPKSSADTLLAMCRHISETGQGAFTWTGPYGSGKSSLVVTLGSLLNGNAKCKVAAENALGTIIAEDILQTLPPQQKGWRILPVVGRRDDPVKVIRDALCSSGLITPLKSRTITEQNLTECLSNIAAESPDIYGGLVIFIDEMGKFLEGAAQYGTDIYFFQQLAEMASRSDKRLIVIGILHQAFEDYANRLSRELRDEWSKIQGRFIDLPINVAGEEQIDLLSRAIVSSHKPQKADEISLEITRVIQGNKRGVSESFAQLLSQCWPLHPVVPSLLGSISRRRFGQNQRSLFGFLNSAEPYAFQDFLARATKADYYTIEHLWEYLRTNLESSILASPDGHRWALAVEAIDRCEAQIAHELHLQLLKAIALIDLFKANSGLVASIEVLEVCYPQYQHEEIHKALEELKRWSYIIYKAHLKAYAIYAGSDFDIDEAVSKIREEIKSIDFQGLKRLAGLQPILAKRHYHSTGTLRWFDVELIPLKDVITTAAAFSPTHGTIGQYLLAIPTENETIQVAHDLCAQAAQQNPEWDVIVGLSKQSWTVNELSLEILATEKVYNESSDLGGDSVARREVRARLSELQGQLEAELNRAFDQAHWFQREGEPEELSRKELSILASELAKLRYPAAPRILNELLNRNKPSSNAIAAQNALLKRMVMHEGKPRLGLEGFPAEGGLFASILEATNLYDNEQGAFIPVRTAENDPYHLYPMWQAAIDLLADNSHRIVTIAEIYDVWRMPPYGVRDGLMPVLVVAYLLAERSNLAFYREGIFQSRLRDIDIEVMVKDPTSIQLRYINLSEVTKKLLSRMAEVVRDLDPDNPLKNLEPIDVARGLVAIYDKVHPWAQRTMHLSKEAIRIRTLFKKANDPNKLVFDDIPTLLDEVVDLDNAESINQAVDLVHSGLRELKDAYPGELHRLREIMLEELQVPNLSPQALTELRERAANVKKVSGDLRLNAFITRLEVFYGTDEDMEAIASMMVYKPPKLWLDNDIDNVRLETTAFAQQFIRTEAFARVKGREDKRHSLSVVVGVNGRPTPVHHDFDIVDSEQSLVNDVATSIEQAVSAGPSGKKTIILAALAELSARYIDMIKEEQRVFEEMKS